jgi:predicted phosphoribosyltransferase
MPNSDIQPPRQYTPLDDEIKSAEEKVRTYRIWRNIIWGSILAWAIVEISIILIAVLTHYPNWETASWLVGFFVPIFAAVMATMIFSGEENAYSRSKLIAAESQLERLKAKRRELGTGRGRSRNSLYQRYKESMPELVERYRLKANHYRSIYNSLQAFIIVGSLSASTFIGAFEPARWAKWAAVVLASSVGISSAIGAHFKLNERSTEMQKVADLIEIEFRAVEFGIGDYEDLTPEEAIKYFVENVERIRTDHMTQKRQLDQPSDVHFVDSSSIN